MPAERRHHSAVGELGVHQLEDVLAVAAVAGVEEPLASGLHIADAAVVLVNDDASAPGGIITFRVQEVEVVATQHRRRVRTPVARVLFEVLLNLLREVLAGPIVDLKAGRFALDHRGQQLIHQRHIPAGVHVLATGHADDVRSGERRVDREVREVVERRERVGRDQNVLGAASRWAPVAITEPRNGADAVQHGGGKLRFKDGRILGRPLHNAVDLLRDRVAPLGALVARADVQTDREVILGLQERVGELLARRVNDPRAFQEVHVGLDPVVACLLLGVRRIAIEA